MKISVLIPVYNAEKYLIHCIESIISQDIYEILLVNDGSTDISGDICDKYGKLDTRIKVFHQENKGASVARNLALEKATGEWIAFVDADDWIENNWYDSVEDSVLNYKDVDIFTFGYNRIKNNKIKQYVPSAGILDIDDYVNVSYSPLGCSYIFKLSKIREYGITFPVGVKLSEDQCFVFKYLSICKKIAMINKAIYNYNENENSAVNRSARKEVTVYSLIAANDFLDFAMSQKVRHNFYSKVVIRFYEEFFHYYSIAKDINRLRLKIEYLEAYKRTLFFYPEFKNNKHYRLACFNIGLAVWFHYRIREIKKIVL
jgi:glycosyltransferase involved in cell wall biosynthesis